MTTATSIKPKTSINIKKVLTFLVLMAAGGGLGFLVSKMSMGGTNNGLQLLPGYVAPKPLKLTLILPLLALAIFLVILIHELGHVLGGWLARFDFKMLVVGPLKITRQNGRLVWERNRIISMAGGLASMLPRPGQNIKRGMLLLTVGGPLASVVLAAACLGLGRHEGIKAWMASVLPAPLAYGLVLFAMLMGIFSAVIGLVTLVPNRAGGFYSDGARLLNLLRGGQQTEAEMLFLNLFTSSAAGLRPRNYDPVILDKMLSLQAPVLYRSYFYLYKYYQQMDLGQTEKAGYWLEQCLQHAKGVPPTVLQALYTEAAFYYAWINKDATRARQALDENGRGALTETTTLARAEAALALLEAQPEAARNWIEKGRKALPNAADRGGAQLEADLLTAMEEEIVVV